MVMLIIKIWESEIEICGAVELHPPDERLPKPRETPRVTNTATFIQS